MKNTALKFPGLREPSTPFDEVRDGRRSLPLWLDIDLSSARSITDGSHLIINISGNSFYIDADTSNIGNATIHFQDVSLGSADAPIFVSAGFIANVPFTQIMVENTAQAGKRLRIFYGVDIDFQAGVNTSISAINTTQVRKGFANSQKTVTNADGQLLVSKADRDYLLIQNKDSTGNIYITFGAAAATIAAGVKIAPGGSYELSNTVVTSQVRAIGDIASNANIVVVEA